MKGLALALATLTSAALAGACASQAPPPAPTMTVSQTIISSTPPPAVSTPVPVLKAHRVAGAGRPDPFVALYGPQSAAPPKPVAVSTFPHIPTLPGFGGGGTVHSVWDGVALTGIVRGAGYTAIVAVNTDSFIVRQGDSVGGKFRVVAIGPDSITLVTTGSPAAERTFSLGG